MSPINYRRLSWLIVSGVFLLFLVFDTVEHGFLPSLHLGRVSWFFTTAVATILSFAVTRILLKNLENVHQRLLEHNTQLVSQAAALSQQSERLSLAVQEAHHRIKNNLQTVAALLLWHEPGAGAADPIRECVNRIQAIATVPDFLTRDSPLERVNAGDVLRQLGPQLTSSLGKVGQVHLDVTVSDVFLSSRRCTSLALVITELVLNSLKHAFPDGRRGTIQLSLKDDGAVTVEVRDDGVGLPAGFCLSRDTGNGLEIASSLTRDDLEGRLDLKSCKGTTAVVRFPREIDNDDESTGLRRRIDHTALAQA